MDKLVLSNDHQLDFVPFVHIKENMKAIHGLILWHDVAGPDPSSNIVIFELDMKIIHFIRKVFD